jgi:Tol biopolymer transport system component
VSAALALILPVAWRGWTSHSTPPSSVRFVVYPPTGASFAAIGASIPSTQLAVAPDGRSLAFIATPAGERSRLWVRSFDNETPRMIPGSDDAAFPFWSADGGSIGFFAQGKLKRIDLTATAATSQTICDAGVDPRGATWNRDGTIVFAASTTSALSRVSAFGGSPTAATTLQSGEESHRWPSFLPDGRHYIFYVRAEANRRGLYLASLDEPGTTRLIDATFNAIYSPTGHLITARDGDLLAYPFDGKTLRVTGDPVRVADQIGGSSAYLASFSLSETGVLAYAHGLTTTSQLTWFDRQGKALGTVMEPGDYTGLRLSPDGRRLAVARVDPTSSTSDIWLGDLNRGVFTRLTLDPGNDVAPVWSPDGTQIVFRSSRAGGNFLFVQPSSGGPARLLGKVDLPFPTDWSPDGRTIVCHGPIEKNGYDLITAPFASVANRAVLLGTSFTEFGGRLSPNGRWMAYASDESGRTEVYVQSMPPSGSNYQVSTTGGFEPRWRHDGKELFYIGLDRRLMTVAVDTAASFQSGPPVALFETRVPYVANLYRDTYDVTADGQRLLVNTGVVNAATPPITIVLNWQRALVR